MCLNENYFSQALRRAMDNGPGLTLRKTTGAGPFGKVGGGLGRRRK